MNAIYAEDALPEGEEQFLELNAELVQEWPVITEKNRRLQMRPNGRIKPINSSTSR